MVNLVELRDIAEEIAEQAAEKILAKRAELGDVREYSTTKSSSVDPVTIVDTMAEEFIAGEIERLRPHDGLIGEEGNAKAATGASGEEAVTWIVDPIDGTVNFLYGLPQFAVSIAAAIDGVVVAGAVINVSTGVLYSAARGYGAFRRPTKSDGPTERLQVNSVTEASQALVATGFSYSSTRRAAQAEILTKVLPNVRDIRRLGSAALDLCMVATGEVDAHYEHGLNCWDYAAGALIAEEAGAISRTPALSTHSNAGELTFVCAPGVEADLERVLVDAGAFADVAR